MSSNKKPPLNKPAAGRTPYGKASGSYGQQGRKYADKRDIEAQVLLKAARKLQDLQSGWDTRATNAIEETLKYNRQIWMMFYDNAVNGEGSAPPQPLRTNIVNLAGFVFKRSMDILADPERDKLNILISINREIAAGLMTKPVAG